MQRVLEDSGVAKADIDGYVSAGGGGMMVDDAVTMSEYLGIDHRWIDGTMTGGSSFEFHVQHAAAAIRDGRAHTILVTYGSDQLTRMGRTLGTGQLRQAAAGPCPGRSSSRRRSATRWSAPTPWSPSATCTSSARPPSSWPRSPSACGSTPAQPAGPLPGRP